MSQKRSQTSHDSNGDTNVEMESVAEQKNILEHKQEGDAVVDNRGVMKGSFWLQGKLLLWKNIQLKKRRRLSTFCEVFVPAIIVLLLSALRATNSNQPITSPASLYANISDLYTLSLSNVQGSLVFIPNSTDVQSIATFLLSSSTVNFNVTFMDSESEFENQVTSSFEDNGPYTAAIVFSSFSPNWAYTIRQSSQLVPPTDQFTILGSSDDSNFFKYFTFTSLQAKIDEYILAYETGQNTSTPDQTLVYSGNLFSVTETVEDPYWDNLTFFTIMLLVFSYMWPFTRMVKMILEEKSTKLKEGLRMMGVRDSAMWFSWISLYAMIYFLSGLFASLMFFVNIMKNSQFIFVALFFWSFSLSIISLGFLFTVLFKKTRTALLASVVGFVGGYLIYDVIGGFDNVPSSVIKIACIYSPTCFGATVDTIGQLESAQLGITGSTLNTSTNTGVTYIATIGFYVLDSLIYLILAWYFEKVLPQEFGVRKPWFFFLQWSYWNPKAARDPLVDNESFDTIINPKGTYEEVDPEFSDLDGVRIRNLRKEFAGEGGSTFVAVKTLNLDIFEGEIFALLGHNGAGKTTTISMLTGLIERTSGDARLFGKRLTSDMDSIHDIIGVCPQQNVLYDDLTVEQHLLMFARLKGISVDESKKLAKDMTSTIGLGEKLKSLSSTLSGGQKRKLAIAIAFVANPKVVFLDEPTSGMDVSSRRATWELIKKFQPGRVIVLTTHFMDEADILANRIGVMHGGELACCGSSLFLKSKYGVGYTMVLTQNPQHSNPVAIKKFIKERVPKTEFINDIGGEIFARMPLNSSSLFPNLLKDLDSAKEDLGVLDFGISVTTLEEVFLKIGKGEVLRPQDSMENSILRNELSKSRNSLDEKHDETDIDNIMKLSGDKQSLEGFSFWRRQWNALFVKRYQHLKRDLGALCCLILLPVFFMTGGVIVLKLNTDTTFDTLTMDFSHYTTPVSVPVSVGSAVNSTSFSLFPSDTEPFSSSALLNNASNSNWVSFASSTSTISENLSDSTVAYFESVRSEFSQDLLEYSISIANTMYGAYVDAPSSSSTKWVWIYVNTTGIHALPIYMNTMSNLFLKQSTSATITVSSHPNPLSAAEKQDLDETNSILLAYFFLMALIFVPSTFIVPIVDENISKAKHQQLVSGVGTSAYWTSHFVFDFLCFLLTLIFILPFYWIYDSDFYLGKNFIVVFLLYIGYGLSIIPMSYCMSFKFSGSLSARLFLIVFEFITGPILSITSYFLDVSGGTSQKVDSYLVWIFRFLPAFNLGEALISIGTNSAGKSVWSTEVAGINLIFLFCLAFLYLGLTLIIENVSSVPAVMKYVRGCCSRKPQEQGSLGHINYVEDSDVAAEKEDILANKRDGDMVITKGLRMEYPSIPPKVALEDLWLSIAEGQCFGLLGVNGAGKTTTMKILTGDVLPSSGQAYLGGLDILKQQKKARRLIGYCPQFDALFPTMTAKEHLEFYARVKGVKEQNLKSIVDGVMHYLSLEEYANRPAGTYSGGNKRKLSVAIALIGDPKIVFLDEPSTGMDPEARRFLWRFIAETMHGRSIILTTHSMDEAESLCSRLGIMVDGRFKCIGTTQHLKSKFGQGYQLHVSTLATNARNLEDALYQLFPDIKLLEKYEGVMRFQIMPQEDQSLADLFEIVESRKEEFNIINYSISQTSLEQIFIQFAQQSKYTEDAASSDVKIEIKSD